MAINLVAVFVQITNYELHITNYDLIYCRLTALGIMATTLLSVQCITVALGRI